MYIITALFFFAAGFLYKKKPILADIKRRIQTIVVPYFCFGFLIFIYWVLIEHRFREVNYDPVKAFLGLFLGEYNTLDFNVHLWFLPCFFLTVVVYNVLINLTGKKITYLIIIVLSLIYALEPVLSFEIPNLPWGADRMCRFIIFYAIGNLAHETSITEKLEKTNIVLKSIGGAVFLAAGFVVSYFFGIVGFVWYIGGLSGIIGVALISITIGRFKIRILPFLGRISIVILCFHGPIYRAVIKLISLLIKQDSESVRENIALVAVIMFFTLLICAGLYFIIDGFVPFMIGKKKEKNVKKLHGTK